MFTIYYTGADRSDHSVKQRHAGEWIDPPANHLRRLVQHKEVPAGVRPDRKQDHAGVRAKGQQ